MEWGKSMPEKMCAIIMKVSSSSTGISLLFVYGTLRRGCTNAQARALHEASDWLGVGRARGRLYRVGWYPAFIGAQGEHWVTGDLFRLHDPELILPALDAYEEAGPGFAEPHEYLRAAVEVERPGGFVTAWTYFYNWPVDGYALIDSGIWSDS